MGEAADIHASALVLDGHADTPQRFLDEPWDFTAPLGRGMINVAAARQGNLAGQMFALWVDPHEHPPGTHFTRACQLAEAVHDQLQRHPSELKLCLTPNDVLAARAEGLFAVLLSIEGGHAIENSLEKLHHFYRLGVRSMTLTWSNSNHWAVSSGDPANLGGLTPFGREVIAEMNRLGMMIDISHVSDRTFCDVLACSKAPIIASHSSARALTPAPRNLTDDQLRAIADSGGIVLVNFFPAFIHEPWRLAWNAFKPEREVLQTEAAAPYRAALQPVPFHISDTVDRITAERIGPPPLASLIDHFEHVIRIAGADHVGLGSDFDGIPMLPAGMHSAADLPRITEQLQMRGHSAQSLHKLLGGNLLRVFRNIQAQAAREPSL